MDGVILMFLYRCVLIATTIRVAYEMMNIVIKMIGNYDT